MNILGKICVDICPKNLVLRMLSQRKNVRTSNSGEIEGKEAKFLSKIDLGHMDLVKVKN